MKVLIGIQARSGSRRFPGKIYEEVAGKSMLERVYDVALSVNVFSKVVDKEVYVLGPAQDQRLAMFCKDKRMKYLAPPEATEDDVLTRYVLAAQTIKPRAVVRLTSDCPLVPSSLIEECVRGLCEFDYVSNTVFRTYPDGYDVQGVSCDALQWMGEKQEENREHPFVDFDTNAGIRREFMKYGFVWKPIVDPQSVVMQKLSVDTPQDLDRVRRVYGAERKS